MILLAIVLQVASPGEPNIVQMDSAVLAWKRCVIDKSVEWSRLQDSAEIIVEGAMGYCSPQEDDLVRAMQRSPVSGMALTRERAIEVITKTRPQLRRAAISAVLTHRAAPKANPR